MKAAVIYNGIPSMVCASSLVKKGLDVELMIPHELGEIRSNGFKLLPYELPMAGLNHRDYDGDLFSFIGLNELKKQISYEKETVNVVFGSNRIDFSYKTIVDDLSRIFPEHAVKVSAFITELKTIEKGLPPLWKENNKLKGSCNRTGLAKLRSFSLYKKYNRNISYLYNKHRIPTSIRLIFDSVLFVFSGTFADNVPFIEAARVIVLALEGVCSPEASVYSLAGSMLKALRGSLQTIDLDNFYEVIRKKKLIRVTSDIREFSFDRNNVVLDGDIVKKDFVSRFNLFNSSYSLKVRYPMSMFFRFDANNIPAPMSKCLIYVDVDDSGFYSEDDIYVLRYTVEGGKAVLRATTFVPYGLFDIDDEGHREKFFMMQQIVEDLVPALTVFDYDCYPNPKDANLRTELEYMFTNLVENDLIYGNIYGEMGSYPLYKGTLFSGRECLYPLGFESSIVSGLSAAESLVRGLKN